MGYRWYDQQKITPLFPFGYGLGAATSQASTHGTPRFIGTS
jgi:hypothetical protein